MGRLNWPSLSRERPKDVFEHANALENDFKALHEHVKTLKASKRHLAKLPSGYTSKIVKGITQGVTEAIDNEYYPKFVSDIDKGLFCKTLLQAIRSELATEAHDRIPLLEFDILHNSYKELVKKLTSYLALDARKRDMTPDSDLEQNRGNGSRLPTSHNINLAATPDFEDEEGGVDSETDEDARDILRTFRTIEDEGTILSHHLELLEGYTEDPGVPDFAIRHARNAMGSGEERRKGVQSEQKEGRRNTMDKGEEGPESAKGEKREVEKGIQDSAIVGYEACKANAVARFSRLQDDDSDSNAMRDLDHDKTPRKRKKKPEHPRKEETRSTHDGATVNNGFAAEFSKSVTFEIKHQATVNRLTMATCQEMIDHLYRSLQKIIATRESLPDLIGLSEPRLLDDGDVMFRADTDSQDLVNLALINAWESEFEACFSPRGPTFTLAMTGIMLNSMDIATRKSKAHVIHELISLNRDRFSPLHTEFDIIDIYWAFRSAGKCFTSLLIELPTRELANEVLQQGFAWQGVIHRCQMVLQASRLNRCCRCQSYGHLKAQCAAPYRCGKCAEAHPTKDCTSPNKQCAACGSGHRAKNKNCPVRKAEQKKIRVPTPEPTAETRKGGPVMVRSQVGNAAAAEGQLLPPSTSGFVPPTDTSVDDEHLRLARCGKCQGYGHVAGKCSARLRCGRCALHHPTWECKSTFTRCAVCNGDHMAGSVICPARPLEKGRFQQLQKSEMPLPPPLRTSTPDPHSQEPEVKSEPQSPPVGVVARPNKTSKKRSILAQVEELIQVVSKGSSHEMAFIKDHLETMESVIRAEGGDILAATPRAGKRRAQEALMSGALQDRYGSPKRIKVEDAPNWTPYNWQL